MATANVAELRASAHALGERIDLRGLSGERAAAGSVVVPLSTGFAAVYRFGCVVLFNVADETGKPFLERIAPNISNAFEVVIREDASFKLSSDGITRIEDTGIVLGNSHTDTLQILGDVLAKSVVLEHYERRIATTFDQLEPLTVTLAKTARVGPRSKALVQHIASALLAEHRLLGRVEVIEKPDLLWEKPELERLHAWLVKEYEIKERHVALERKLSLLSRTAQVLLDLLHARRSLRVEWYIVALIVVEVVLMLFWH